MNELDKLRVQSPIGSSTMKSTPASFVNGSTIANITSIITTTDIPPQVGRARV